MPTQSAAIYCNGGYEYENITGTPNEIRRKVSAKIAYYRRVTLTAITYWVVVVAIYSFWPNFLFILPLALTIWLISYPAQGWTKPVKSYQRWRGWRKHYRQSVRTTKSDLRR